MAGAALLFASQQYSNPAGPLHARFSKGEGHALAAVIAVGGKLAHVVVGLFFPLQLHVNLIEFLGRVADGQGERRGAEARNECQGRVKNQLYNPEIDHLSCFEDRTCSNILFADVLGLLSAHESRFDDISLSLMYRISIGIASGLGMVDP